MHAYPHFFNQVKSKINRDTLTSASRRTKQRTLSIVDKEGKVVPVSACKKAMKSEYDHHFTAKNSIIFHPEAILAKQQKNKRAKTARNNRIKRKKNADGEAESKEEKEY